MMTKLIQALFPEGHRKLMVSLVGLAVGIAIEKLGGGLTDQTQVLIIAAVGIFTGGNVMEHLATALGGLKGSKVGQIIEDIIPGDQGLGKAGAAVAAQPAVAEQFESMNQFLNDTHAKMEDLERKLQLQAQNTTQIVQLLNQRMTAPKAPVA